MAVSTVMPRSKTTASNSVKALVQLQRELEFWAGKAAKLKLSGEYETYKWEYDTCLERMALFQRLLDKRQEALLRSSSTKPSP